MDIDRLATRYEIALPAWIEDAVRDVPEYLPEREDRMALVHALADRNWRARKRRRPSPRSSSSATAAGELVSVGVNVVLWSGAAPTHAEVTALGLAQPRARRWDLGGEDLPALELVVNWRPCVQCYGATLWSGVRRLVVAGSGPELEEISTFNEGPMREDWAAQFEARGIEVVDGVLRDEALEVFRAYRAHVDAGEVLVYNARAAD